jgi:hypothetical protein
MATNESEFKTDFRNDLADHFKEKVLVWTNNDMYRVGLPDFSASYDGHLWAVEAKFIKNLPARGTSKTLDHEATATQLQFLRDVRKTGNFAAILIGLSNVAVVMLDLKANYTLDEVRAAPRILRAHGAWQVKEFFNIIQYGPLHKSLPLEGVRRE